MSKGMRFADEFKQDAVEQVVERDYAVSEVAERLGISTKFLYTWQAQFELTANFGDGRIFRWRIMDVIHASNISRKGKIRHDRDYSYTPHAARGIFRSADVRSAQRRSGAVEPGH